MGLGCGEIQHGLFHVGFGRQLRRPGRLDIDMAGGAGAGAAAIGVDAGDPVLAPRLPSATSLPALSTTCSGAIGLDESDSSPSAESVSWEWTCRPVFPARTARIRRSISCPIRYSGAAFTASTAATAPSRRWKTANLRDAGSPAHHDDVDRAAPGPRSAASDHTGPTRTRALRYRSWACPPSPAPHAWPGRWRSARIPAGSPCLRGR